VVAECLAGGLACGDQRRRTGSGSTLEVLHDDALYKYTLTLLYFTPVSVSNMKQKTLSLLLNDAVKRESFKSVGSRFQALSAATEKAFLCCRTQCLESAADRLVKALSAIFRLVLGTTKSQLLDERSDDREGMSEAGVNRLAMEM